MWGWAGSEASASGRREAGPCGKRACGAGPSGTARAFGLNGAEAGRGGEPGCEAGPRERGGPGPWGGSGFGLVPGLGRGKEKERPAGKEGWVGFSHGLGCFGFGLALGLGSFSISIFSFFSISKPIKV